MMQVNGMEVRKSLSGIEMIDFRNTNSVWASILTEI